ncbi:MAG: fucose isomerase, partial [Candidatus Bathyarchaeia archaeon]
GEPSALVDWNNNYGQENYKCFIFHCGNMPKSILEIKSISFKDVYVKDAENAFGVCVGRIKDGPVTFARLTTDDVNGKVKAYIGEGELTLDPADTFGAYGIIKVPDLQTLMRYICKNGFEHHVAINKSRVAKVIYEALNNYLGIEVYWHKQIS